MMNDDRDERLLAVFAEARHDLADESFTCDVMGRARRLKYWVAAGLLSAALVLATGVWMLAIPQEFGQLVAQALTTTLIDLGDGWLGWALSPINNIGGLLVLIAKALRMLWKKVRNASYKD